MRDTSQKIINVSNVSGLVEIVKVSINVLTVEQDMHKFKDNVFNVKQESAQNARKQRNARNVKMDMN